MKEQIGAAAGLIWQHLSEHGATTVEALKRGTKLQDRVLFMGLGWLAREGKLEFDDAKKALRVALRPPEA